VFLASQVTFFLAKEYWRTDLRDPEYGLKLACLRQVLEKRPMAQPVILVLGSSRVGMGFQAEVLAVNQGWSPDAPIVFNFGMTECCGARTLLVLRRLLADGIRPEIVLVELWPMALGGGSALIDHFEVSRLSWKEVALLCPFTDAPGRLKRKWCQSQLVPFWSHRRNLLNRFAPLLVSPSKRIDCHWRDMGSCGCVAMPQLQAGLPPAQADLTKQIREREYSSILAGLKVHSHTDQAIRQLLRLLRDEGIASALMITPEPSYIRRCYSPDACRAIADYLGQLEREFATPVIDARDWVPDEEFFEGIHVIHAGAVTFAKRFERDALPALLSRSLWKVAE
jgi:hypothetical protein